MNDTEIINWIQQNVIAIREDFNELIIITWLDKGGIPQFTGGNNLRDCVRGAASENKTNKDKMSEMINVFISK